MFNLDIYYRENGELMRCRLTYDTWIEAKGRMNAYAKVDKGEGLVLSRVYPKGDKPIAIY